MFSARLKIMTTHDERFRGWMAFIFSEHTPRKLVIDIGGGLRLKNTQGDRYDASTAWISTLAEKVDYKIMDPVDTFHPDIVGDIHKMPFVNNSIDAIICASVLEHVTNPFTAAEEIYRTLKPGGLVYVYVPFLYYYHSEPGYFGDYWRFTEEAIRELFKKFSSIEIVPIRGALETWVILNPHTRFLEPVARVIDNLIGKNVTKQVSAYAILLTK
ncbi:MAG: hypothetical protein A2845_03345 [Candidatus Lloydbacteria bacterium RIFCSPHIGHO2_01_FULL_49_22]|uniref:Methyltransferase type 11 domain-containing protein n=1 Tax=Candidatus Lloydbacteria bacterium RIFCSPHIGHO2_01_FULL_49_22 TaxID=1798658 RepID=A0A1G2CWS2_9BACT|nr:MAG: hypothetical protein A2845_03345 [Candidatus Lloydbacteria bacterium RIFCSPHIGHO2_01_FULL_49_22]OGZ08966.1 MAG: hypothetical protein A3C14_03180 [Candidatus Lloydbacteria bacterium RIFCSPHIGHO2_02_FULL_50_18]